MKTVRIRIPQGNPKSKSKRRNVTFSVQGRTRKEAVANAKRFYKHHLKNMQPLQIAGGKKKKKR